MVMVTMTPTLLQSRLVRLEEIRLEFILRENSEDKGGGGQQLSFGYFRGIAFSFLTWMDHGRLWLDLLDQAMTLNLLGLRSLQSSETIK